MKFIRAAGGRRMALFVVLSISVITGVAVMMARARLEKLETMTLAEWHGRLTASLGPTQSFVAAWVDDRFAQAREAAGTIITVPAPRVQAHERTLHARNARDDTVARELVTHTRSAGFIGLWMIDTAGVVVGADGETAPLASEIAAARTVATKLTELVAGPSVDTAGRARIAIITPIPTRRLALVLVYDAGQTLFPLVSREGGAEHTIRTKFLAVDTNGFHIVSPSAYPASEALGRIVPRKNAPLPWRLAADGVDTIGTFVDLEGHRIIAATTFLSSAKWGIVRAIDEREAFEPAHARFRAECIVVLSLLAACAALCTGIYRDARKRERVDALHRRVQATTEEHRRMQDMHDEMERQVAARTTDLRTALGAAEFANRAKSEFLARMSHELRTPLNSIIGFTNVLMKNKAGNLQAQDLVYLGRVGDNGKNLLAHINSILDLAKIESGHMEIEYTQVHLGTLVTDVARQLDGVLRDRPVTLITDVPASVECIWSDAAKLQQILVNLVGNAAKFTEHGSITVRVVTAPYDARPMRIEIQDTGIGIPSDRLGTIFKPFEQGDNTMTRRYGGTGLGLAITWSLCELLHARLTVDSTVGLGSTFVVHFDQHIAAGVTQGSFEDSEPADRTLVASA